LDKTVLETRADMRDLACPAANRASLAGIDPALTIDAIFYFH
jgi:hypothetical protein